jgi:hypothetical protein
MANKLTTWRKAGRFITGAVVVAFFLPFFGISCQNFDIVAISGTDMVAGCDLGAQHKDDLDPEASKALEKAPVEPLAIIAFACAIIGFGLAWVRSRGALIGALVVSLAGIGALVGLYVKVGGEIRDAVAEMQADIKRKTEGGGRMAEEVRIEAGGRMGLWLAFLAFGSTAALAGMALREREGAVPRATALPPPPGAPPPPPGPTG